MLIKYLKAAFWVRSRVPGLGDLPVNVLALAPVLALGFWHPAIWLIGAGFEIAFLFLLGLNPRFQRLTDLPSEQQRIEQATQAMAQLRQRLPAALAASYDALQLRVQQTTAAYTEFNTPDYISEPNTRNLDQLLYLYLKLLLAQATLSQEDSATLTSRITDEITTLRTEITNDALTPKLRASKSATLELLHRRLVHFQQRDQALTEVASDLRRIEAQVHLAADNARLQSRPDAVSLDLDLASDTMQDSWYAGGDEALLSTIETTYAQIVAE